MDDRADGEELRGRLAEAEARAERADERADEAGRRADAALALADRTLAQLADIGATTDAEITTLRDAVDSMRSTIARTEMCLPRIPSDLVQRMQCWPYRSCRTNVLMMEASKPRY